MTKISIPQDTKTGQATYTQDLLEDITLPLDPILSYLRTAEHTDCGACPHVTDILLKNAQKNLKEITSALEARFGKIKIKHEGYNPNLVLYPWSKIVGVVVKNKKEGRR